jgi:hypothetical protein
MGQILLAEAVEKLTWPFLRSVPPCERDRDHCERHIARRFHTDVILGQCAWRIYVKP